MNQPSTSTIPVGVLISVQQRLGRLSPEAADILTAAAVLGNQFDLGLLGRLAGVGEPAAIDALNQASGVQLVEPGSGGEPEFRFRHPLIRDAIVSDLRPPDRAARSGRAAPIDARNARARFPSRATLARTISPAVFLCHEQHA